MHRQRNASTISYPTGRMLLGVSIATLTLLLVCCASSGGGKVSEGEARRVLEAAVDATFASDEEALCGLYSAPEHCINELREAGGIRSAPSVPPELAESYPLEQPEGTEDAGWVLVLQGTDGEGEPYRNEFLVFDGGSHGLVARYPIWWKDLGVGYARSAH